jgi:RsmE family RNA methyltransferase
MNLLLLFAKERDASGHFTLEAERARHLLSVLKVQPGQQLRAGLAGGATGTACVVSTTADTVTVAFATTPAPAEEQAEETAVGGQIHLVLALPRPKILPRALEAAVTLGVASVSLVNAWRVERAYFDSPKATPEQLAEVVHRACEQARDTRLPTVEVFPRLMPFVQERLRPMLAVPATQGLVAHPGSPLLEETAQRGSLAHRVVIAIGPEGGWVERELATFRELGMSQVALGERILRTEHAVVALLSQLAILSRLDRLHAPRS